MNRPSAFTALRNWWGLRRSLARLRIYHSARRSLSDVVTWALDFRGGGGPFRVKTLQKRSEILGLAERVAALNPQRILEIGTARGGTLLIWSSLAQAQVVSCDLRNLDLQRELFEKFPPPHSRCKVTLLSGDSHQEEMVERVQAALGGQQVDFLFIDGDHTEGGVAEDFRMYRHFVRPGGLIAFHDIVEKQPLATNQVQFFWPKVKVLFAHEELIDDAHQTGYGIGVLRVPATSANAR